MTCRHHSDDPDCSSYKGNVQRAREIVRKDDERKGKKTRVASPDSSEFDVLDAVEAGHNLVLKVKYPSCSECSYEGTKILVYLNASIRSVLRWRKIDPHFSDTKCMYNEAPGPNARFPASEDGWEDALEYAYRKAGIWETIKDEKLRQSGQLRGGPDDL